MNTVINARGKACPIPVILTKQAMAKGETALTTEVDNDTAVENLKRLADNQGFSASVRTLPDGFAVDFVKTGCTPCQEAVSSPLPQPGGSWTVFVPRDIVGAGDRTLGTNLIRMFFYTLAQSDDLPESILFMNDGVKLPACDEQVAEHLKVLQDKGVEILVCGTCLNFYNLTEQLKIGTVSNMFDIVTKMQQAAKVITV